MSRYILARRAARDLDEIWVYIAQHGSVEAAERVRTSLTGAFEMIAEYPAIGGLRHDIQPGWRNFIVNSYRVHYRQARGFVRILRVVHAARDERKLFRRS
jgi:toxin ParE1/3/4